VRIGIDLGGTKIEAIALDGMGAERARRRVPTPRDDYPATIEAIGALVEDVERELGGTARVGVGMPGTLSPATGLVKNANSVWLNGQALDRDLTARLRRPLRFANDANCFALSEAVDGAGAGARVVFGVIIGTGTGGGVAVDGAVLTGPNAIAGEWGHNPMPWPTADEWPGPPCYCGRTGCVETFLSGPGLAADYRRASGGSVEATEIAERAAQGDVAARGAVLRYEDRLTRALASVINVLDPDVIVLGGGMSNLPGLCEAVPRRWGTYVFSDRVDTRLARARHGDSSGVRGAAWLWPA
jgi:fructokinase